MEPRLLTVPLALLTALAWGKSRRATSRRDHAYYRVTLYSVQSCNRLVYDCPIVREPAAAGGRSLASRKRVHRRAIHRTSLLGGIFRADVREGRRRRRPAAAIDLSTSARARRGTSSRSNDSDTSINRTRSILV